MLPFYDHYLKGKSTDYLARPNVEYAVRGANVMRSAETLAAAGHPIHALVSQRVGVRQRHVAKRRRAGAAARRWRGRDHLQISATRLGRRRGRLRAERTGRRLRSGAPRADLHHRAARQAIMEICGPIKLVLYASSSARDTDFFIKLSDQFPQIARGSRQGTEPVRRADHARLAARLAPRARSRAQHRHGALSQPFRSAAADAE